MNIFFRQYNECVQCYSIWYSIVKNALYVLGCSIIAQVREVLLMNSLYCISVDDNTAVYKCY